MRNFRSLTAWAKAAKKAGCTVKLVSKTQNTQYFQARKNGAVVGFFNEAPAGWLSMKSAGHLDPVASHTFSAHSNRPWECRVCNETHS